MKMTVDNAGPRRQPPDGRVLLTVQGGPKTRLTAHIFKSLKQLANFWHVSTLCRPRHLLALFYQLYSTKCSAIQGLPGESQQHSFSLMTITRATAFDYLHL